MDKKKKISSFTQDLLERESMSEEQRERRETRRKMLEERKIIQEREAPAKARRARERRRTMLVLFLAVAIAGVFTVRSVQKMVSLTQERARVQAQLDALEKRRSELENELLMVNSDEYVEQQARSQLHMIKPGEVLYIVPSSTEYSTSAPTEEETPEAQPADGAKP